ncbi:glutamic acid-rich protein-like [Papaver somniferum]|uniref:glutamic acid-rich protein-like n=1 Tax=Papaver somniferum TaxID=3469 RepID=UPI000E6F5F38|nr:glutamic acid-rich protein-like [Papaver somniferum]
MAKGNKVVSKTNTPTVEFSTSTEEENPTVEAAEIQKSTSQTMRSKSTLKDSKEISSPTAEEENQQHPNLSVSDVMVNSMLNVCTDTNKPYRSGFNAINEFVNKNFEKDGEVRKKRRDKVWFTEFQLEKQKESRFWPVVDVFVNKKAENKEEENSEKKQEKNRDLWFKSPESILKIVNQFRHDHSGKNVFVFNTAEEKKFVEVESMPEDLFFIFELQMYWFFEHNNSMTPSNEQGFPRFLRWVISDISNTIDKDINEAMKKMQPGWVKPWSDEQQKVMEEYRKNMQQHITDALKEKPYEAQHQRDKALEELSDLQVKHQKLISFIEEKAKKIYEADLRNVQNDKDVVDLFVETLQEIISLNKKLQSEDERDDDEQEEEQGETSGKDGDGEEEEEEGQQGNRSGKADDVDDSDKDQEEEEGDEYEEDGGGKGGDEEDGGGKGGDDQQDEEEGGGKGGDIHDDDLQGGKGGDMRGDDTDKEGSKGGDCTPLSNTNEEKDGKDGTRQGVESETAKKPRG